MTVSELIIRRIERSQPGWVFTRYDLIDLGTPHAVGMVLIRLVRSGRIRRIARGLYDIPRTHRTLGILAPSPETIAEAIARRDGAWIQPAEAMAANLLNLSEQVPAKIVYETDGPRRTILVGRLEIQFVKRPPRQLRNAARMSSLLFSALRSLGRARVTNERVAHLRKTLTVSDRRQLLKDLPSAPAWMHPFVRFIAAGQAPAAGTRGQSTSRARKGTGR
jgi:hypothetical protein